MTRSRRPRLVRDRITLASIGILAGGLAVVGTVTSVLLSQQLSRDVQSILKERTSSQLTTLVRRDDRLQLRRVDDSALDRQSWAYSNGAAIERPAASQALQTAADALSRVPRTTERPLGESVEFRATPVFGDNKRRLGTVVVATSLQPYEDTERIGRIATVLLSAIVLLLGAFVVRRAVKSALRPVGIMAARAADWSEHHPDRRMSLGPRRDELTSLAATLDELLGRIDAALRHEQRFSAEVAHELRTPLSGVRAEAELALREPDLGERSRESFEAILASVDRMSSAIDTLLLAARAPGAHGEADCSVVVNEVVRAFASAAGEANVAIEVRQPPAALRVGADQEQVAQALAPLLDNAIGHAASRVAVSSAAADGMVILRVEDDGAGLAAGEERDIFAAGVSLRGGAGLGLPLARRLARACGGDVVAVQGSSGGRFELRLPGVAASGG